MKELKEKTTEEWLRKHSVLDGHGNVDGEMVPLSIAMHAIDFAIKGRLEHKPPTWIRKSEDEH